jgi:broad specificity phosphatase PhoE
MKEKFTREDENNEKTLNVNIFRHGESDYKKEEKLTEKGVDDVNKGAEELVKLIGPDEEVEIWSSPSGRTLQTSEIIAQVFKKNGVAMRKGAPKIFEQLSEVKNFSWRLFIPLVRGGEVEFAQKKFSIDNNLTNPQHMDSSEYFFRDGIRHIDPAYLQQLPLEYRQEIEGFENFAAATQRLMRPLSRVRSIKDKSYRIVMVTHEALTGFTANIFSGGEMRGINPGEFINLERVGNKLVCTRVGGLSEGNKDIDVIDAFYGGRSGD